MVIALSYLDRHLSRRVVDRRSFQLAATACLCLSAKVHGEDLSSFRSGKRRQLRIPEVAYLSGGYLEARDIAYAELDVLHSLSWLVHPPTPLAFARDLLCLLDPTRCDGDDDDVVARQDAIRGRKMEIEETVEYLIELSSCDYALSTRFRPSSVAIASIAHSVELTSTMARRDGSSSSSSHVALEFLQEVVERAGLVVADDGDVTACLARLREVHAPASCVYHGEDGVGGGDCGAREVVVASPICPSRME